MEVQRVVIDTNVLVSGLRSRRGASFGVLQGVAERRFVALATIGLFLEYEAVLKREQQLAAHGFSIGWIDRFLAEMAALCEPVDVHFLWRPQLADPSDEMVLEAVVNGRGAAIVTHNVAHFERASQKFDFVVMKPARFLMELSS